MVNPNLVLAAIVALVMIAAGSLVVLGTDPARIGIIIALVGPTVVSLLTLLKVEEADRRAGTAAEAATKSEKKLKQVAASVLRVETAVKNGTPANGTPAPAVAEHE